MPHTIFKGRYRRSSDKPGSPRTRYARAFFAFADFVIGVLTNGTLRSTRTWTYDAGTGTLLSSGFMTSAGDGPYRVFTTGALPAGLAANTDYFLGATGAGTPGIFPTQANAIAGTSRIVLAAAGTGTHSIALKARREDILDALNAGKTAEQIRGLTNAQNLI